MTAGIIKPVANETFCNTIANTYGNEDLIRLYNSNTANAYLVTRANTTANVASITIGPSMELIIEKAHTDTLQSNNATNQVFAAPVAYKSV